jgi:two-component system, NarL family, nitrate/nitrite response regulator NarL
MNGGQRTPAKQIVVVSLDRVWREAVARAIETMGHRAAAVAELRSLENTDPEVVLIHSVIGLRETGATVQLVGAARAIVVGVAIGDLRPYITLGVAGILTDDAGLDQVMEGVGVVSDGYRFMSQRAIQAVASSPESAAGVSDLTRRELEIASLAALGLTNKEIAAHLTIELQTVKNHVHNILTKLRISNRRHLPHVMHLHLSQSRRPEPAATLSSGVLVLTQSQDSPSRSACDFGIAATPSLSR